MSVAGVELRQASPYSIIQCRGEDVGAISVERHPDFIKLSQLVILPQHQNKGIGTSLVRELALEARQAGTPLRLRVLKNNPARRFYERLGFRVSSTTPERVYMELNA
jgi:ribosomal protein S18 acetylase RimI-like enzyme